MSRVPDPDARGVRRYNAWAGNPKGHPEDKSRCAVSVTPNERGGFVHSHQCRRPRGHGPGGLYCKQHEPAAERARRDAASKRYQAKIDRLLSPSRRADAFEAVLREIAGGHNDPRRLAADALEQFEQN